VTQDGLINARTDLAQQTPFKLVVARYLGRKGYEPATGTFVVACHRATAKAVACFDGQFGRSAFHAVLAEAKALGLDRLTVIVHGLVTYSGGTLRTIRVGPGIEPAFLEDDIQNDLMADLTVAKRRTRSQRRGAGNAFSP
jgi:hypothetical protein